MTDEIQDIDRLAERFINDLEVGDPDWLVCLYMQDADEDGSGVREVEWVDTPEKNLLAMARLWKKYSEAPEKFEKEPFRMVKENCPCVLTGDACSYACTCVRGIMSGGCAYCPIYGSLEQRKHHAEWIIKAIKWYDEFLQNARIAEIEQLLHGKRSIQDDMILQLENVLKHSTADDTAKYLVSHVIEQLKHLNKLSTQAED